jgi:hypothetical protein
MKKMIPVLLVVMISVVSGFYFLFQGVSMHNQVSIEEARFHMLQSEYFILSKSDRESAPTGSELNKKLIEIQNYPSELLRLKLVGLGKILTGVFAMLFTIAIFLFMMPIRLAQMINKDN